MLLPLAGLLTLTGLGFVAANAQTPPPAPSPTPGAPITPGKPGHERHPEMMKAMKSLEKAKADLQNAAKDYDGHRAKALQLTDQAIQEVKAALQSDRK